MNINELTEAYFMLSAYEKRAFHLVTNLEVKESNIPPVEYYVDRIIKSHERRFAKKKALKEKIQFERIK